ncbi:Mu transposase C-terminal domain-containing protein [Dechloromonas hortensis]|uniref:Mu transposase C-terminal domain-containing protein n=1 Tax=Dechloromonas hortensis TaxID=337779 RepID=UPI001290E889|nr:Mu transposase C-terminal domain-containing protein [Dechloromonas hortensis]
MVYLNDILYCAESQSRFRVIHLDFSENQAWLFQLTGDNCLPKLALLDELIDVIESRQFVVEQCHSAPITLQPSEAAKKARNSAHELIKPLVATTDILIPRLRNTLINQRASETGTSPRTLLKHLRAWWLNGQCPDALLPAFNKRGSTSGSTANRGRPPKYADRPIFQVTADDLACFKTVIDGVYLKGEVSTLAGAYQKLRERYYSRTDSEGRPVLLPDGEAPTYMQFRRAFFAAYPQAIVIRKKKGDSEYELNSRPVLGSLYAETYTVGDIFEIDSTIADVFLVSSKNRARIIGKPTLYLIVDRKSWLITGFYVGFESASWPAAMQAILSISEDKERLCKRYGVPYDPNDWPAHGVFPKEFVADRGGEMLSKDSTALCDGLAVNVRNLPKRRADHKPFVECSFKLIHQPISQVIPGYEPPCNVTKRQGKHYEQDAALTLDEFIQTILRVIIRHNRSVRTVDRLSAEQVLDGDFLPIPIDVWNREIRQRAGALSRIGEERVRFALLPKTQATVTHEGIRLGECYYGCPEAMDRGWYDIARRSGTYDVPVSFDLRLMDDIYIHDTQSPTGYVTATLLDKCRDFRGLSKAEADAIAFFRKRLENERQMVNRQTTFEFNQAVEPLAQKALAEAKAASKGKSRKARKKDIVQDRTDELRRERQSRGAAAPSTAPITATVIPLPVSTCNITTSSDTPEARRQQKLMDLINGN